MAKSKFPALPPGSAAPNPDRGRGSDDGGPGSDANARATDAAERMEAAFKAAAESAKKFAREVERGSRAEQQRYRAPGSADARRYSAPARASAFVTAAGYGSQVMGAAGMGPASLNPLSLMHRGLSGTVEMGMIENRLDVLGRSLANLTKPLLDDATKLLARTNDKVRGMSDRQSRYLGYAAQGAIALAGVSVGYRIAKGGVGFAKGFVADGKSVYGFGKGAYNWATAGTGAAWASHAWDYAKAGSAGAWAGQAWGWAKRAYNGRAAEPGVRVLSYNVAGGASYAATNVGGMWVPGARTGMLALPPAGGAMAAYEGGAAGVAGAAGGRWAAAKAGLRIAGRALGPVSAITMAPDSSVPVEDAHPGLKNWSADEARRGAAWLRGNRETWLGRRYNNMIAEPLAGSAADTGAWLGRRVGIDRKRVDQRAYSTQLEDYAARKDAADKAAAEKKPEVTPQSPGFGEVGSAYIRTQELALRTGAGDDPQAEMSTTLGQILEFLVDTFGGGGAKGDKPPPVPYSNS